MALLLDTLAGEDAARPAQVAVAVIVERQRPGEPRLPRGQLLPLLLFFTIGRPISGIICLIFQLTVIGWVVAAIWAVYALSQYNTDRKIAESMGR